MKTRCSITALAILAACMNVAPAQEPLSEMPWANKLFGEPENLKHNFGDVHHGLVLRQELVVTNIYKVPIEVTNVQTAMGPLHPEMAKHKLQPGEKTILTVQMDASRFANRKESTVYITIGGQYASQARLAFKAFSREDFTVEPGQVDFGKLPPGKAKSLDFVIEHSGMKDWRLVDLVVTNGAPFEARAVKFKRDPDIVGYRVTVKLDKDAPTGQFLESILVRSNDASAPTFFIDVRGNIVRETGFEAIVPVLDSMRKILERRDPPGTPPPATLPPSP
jgi:Protein of unknown function (DUF1573)